MCSHLLWLVAYLHVFVFLLHDLLFISFLFFYWHWIFCFIYLLFFFFTPPSCTIRNFTVFLFLFLILHSLWLSLLIWKYMALFSFPFFFLIFFYVSLPLLSLLSISGTSIKWTLDISDLFCIYLHCFLILLIPLAFFFLLDSGWKLYLDHPAH